MKFKEKNEMNNPRKNVEIELGRGFSFFVVFCLDGMVEDKETG